MKTVKDTELTYLNGGKILEGDKVDFEWFQFRAVPEKIRGTIIYKNAAFYIESDLTVNGEPAVSITIASILENNAQVPRKSPMNIIKVI